MTENKTITEDLNKNETLNPINNSINSYTDHMQNYSDSNQTPTQSLPNYTNLQHLPAQQPLQQYPNVSAYAPHHQQQQYPIVSAYVQQQQQYPIVSAYASSNNAAVAAASFMNPPLNPAYNPASYYNRAPQFNNHHHLNSSLHQPHSIDLNDSLSRSFNGVPSNFALLNPPPLLQALPFLAQNNQLSAQLHSWLADYNLWQETIRRDYQLANNKNLIPLKFEKNHSSIRFGNSNQLITVHGKSILIKSIRAELIESGENTLINTWPGPLLKEQTNKSDVIEYIKGQEKIIGNETLPEYHYLNQEKSQIWQLLSMMIKQNGDLSSSELAEFLISKNESEFYTDDGGTELGKFRRFLLLGQKKNALDYARKVGLWGHTFALAYLISSPQFNEIMMNSVNDFTDSTLTKDDPIFTLYRRLLQNLQKNNPKLLHSISTVLPPSNLQQFTILLANNCEISPILPGSAFVSEVLKLIVALRDHKSTFIDLNSLENFFLRNLIKTDTTKYSEELLFMNEIFEFCQKSNRPLIEIIPFKAIFAAKLYDYGRIEQSKMYCELITNVYKSHVRYMCFENGKKINWPLIMYIVEVIESKIDKVLSDNMMYSYQTTPISNEESHPLSSPDVEEEDSEQNDIISNELDSELENLHLNNEISHHPIEQPQQQINKININQQPFMNQPPPQQFSQKKFNIQPQQQPQMSQQRERSDSVQSMNRQRTVSRTSSNMSNFANQSNKTEPPSQSASNKVNQGATIQSKQPPINQSNAQPLTIKTNDLSSLSSNSKLKNETAKPVQQPPAPQQQHPTFFVPKFSPSDNLPPIDFVSKPPIEPTNLLEETNDETSDDVSNLPNNNPFQAPSSNYNSNFNANSKFNSTLNPPMAQASQNYSFSPQVSPITSPILNTNQIRNSNMNNMSRKQEQQPLSQQSKKETSEQNNPIKKEDKPGLLDWVKNKIVPKGPNEVHLPDDDNQRFYYDSTLNRWVDTQEENNETNQIEDQKRAGPPKLGMMNQPPTGQLTTINPNSSLSTSHNFSSGPPQFDSSQFSFTKSKQKRYVDVPWQ